MNDISSCRLNDAGDLLYLLDKGQYWRGTKLFFPTVVREPGFWLPLLKIDFEN